MRYDLATLWVPGDGGLVPAAAVGRPLDLMESVPFDRGFGLRTWVFATGRPVRIPSRGRGFRDEPLRGFLALPLQHGTQRVGVLALARTDCAFSDGDEEQAWRWAARLARVLAEEADGA